MYSTQPRWKWPRNAQKASIHSPCQMGLCQDEIQLSPNHVNRSIRLHNRPGLNRKSLASAAKTTNKQLANNVESIINANLSICRFYSKNQSRQNQIQRSFTPRLGDYQTTADRMLNLRRRLSPVKRNKEENRKAQSVDTNRDQSIQRTSFLNIEKLELIQMYAQVETQQQSTAQEPVDDRYVGSPIKKTRRGSIPQQFYGQTVVELRKALRQSYTSKWVYPNLKRKPFSAPFQRYHYKDFIWKVAFSNGLLLTSVPEDMKLKVYVGKGNNSQLVRSLIRRRNWWSFTERWQQANLVWTQLKISGYFNLQEQASKDKWQRSSLPLNVSSRNELNLSIMNQNDVIVWDKYWRENRSIEQKMTEDMVKRNVLFKKLNPSMSQVSFKNIRINNHMCQNFVIGNKKALLYTMKQYYDSKGENVFQYLPLSFHIVQGIDDPDYFTFLRYFYEKKKKSNTCGNNVWIVKPGELTNRGNGIIVCLKLEEIKAILKRGGKHHDGSSKTFIVQQYIEKPFLYQRRKFDIRHYILVTSINGRFKGYWFKRGYIRTSSSEYTLNHGQASVHLTNDAVQKNLPDYGRYEKGNKVSYEDFQAYILKQYSGKYDFFGHIYPLMKKIATDAIRASARSLNPRNLQQNFELFGLDFMIDGNFRPWLIQCNSNPCLQLSCPLLASIIPALIQNTLRICVDSLASPPSDFTQKRPRFTDNALANNEFELVYDSLVDQSQLHGSGILCNNLNAAELDKEEDEEFQDDGQALED